MVAGSPTAGRLVAASWGQGPELVVLRDVGEFVSELEPRIPFDGLETNGSAAKVTVIVSESSDMEWSWQESAGASKWHESRACTATFVTFGGS